MPQTGISQLAHVRHNDLYIKTSMIRVTKLVITLYILWHWLAAPSSTGPPVNQRRLHHARPACISSGCWHSSNRPDKKDPAETTRHWQPFNTAEQADSTQFHTQTHKCAPLPHCASHSVPPTSRHSLTHSTHWRVGKLPTIISPQRCQARLFIGDALPLPPFTCTLSFQLIKCFTIPVFPCVTDSTSSDPIIRRKKGHWLCV